MKSHIIAFKTDLLSIVIVSGTFIFIAVGTVASELSKIEKEILVFELMFGYYYGNPTDIGYSVIIMAVGGCLSVLAAVYIFSVELCTYPWLVEIGFASAQGNWFDSLRKDLHGQVQKENNYGSSNRE